MKISVLGCGRWGSFIAWYLCSRGNEVYSWGPEEDYSYRVLKETGRNEYVELDKRITLTCDLQEAVCRAEIIVISISSQGLRGFMQKIMQYDVKDKTFVLCMKGVEVETGKRLSEVLVESGVSKQKIAVWVGPGHIQSFVEGIPNCMVIDSENEGLKMHLVDSFKSELIRFYYGNDLIGTELGAAAKNVMGIAAGILDVVCVPLKGPLMARGAREVARLIKAAGGNELSAYGLAHLGDYETTLFSPYSHNRQYGESLAKGERFEKLAEGVATSKAMKLLGERYGVELPITNAVYNVCYGSGNDKERCKEEIGALFTRSTKFELE
ncbi:MAG: NAD(P)-binding domain-containing protein [Clostridia bacterium]|nr:NAD(P)-binding domain-containing protein [Clostridia bacterium]